MSFPFEEVYHIYLSHLEEQNYIKRYKGHEDKYGMSRAGQCFLKHYYFRFKYERFPLDELRKQRVPRLGQLLHKDFEDALDFFKNSPRKFPSIDSKYHSDLCSIRTERMVVADDKRGHVDTYISFKKIDKLEVYDLKSIGSWGWKIKFGKTKIEDTNRFNQLQLSTYTLALMNTLGIKNAEMYLVYYNKDSSEMKTVPVANACFDEAKNYWDELKSFMKSAEHNDYINAVMPYEYHNIPVEKWECGWCSYQPHCSQIINNIGK